MDFNEDGTSALTITGFDASSTGLAIAAAADDWAADTNVDAAATDLDAALSTLRTNGKTLSSNSGVVTTRQEFTTNLINTLTTGADKLTAADTNEEGANMLALQTRQQLGVVALQLSNQAQQSILRLFSVGWSQPVERAAGESPPPLAGRQDERTAGAGPPAPSDPFRHTRPRTIMALRLTLRPHERVIVGGAVIRNSESRCELLIENEVPVLREPDILSPSAVRTPCERIYLALQLIYVDHERFAEHMVTYEELVSDVQRAAPSLTPPCRRSRSRSAQAASTRRSRAPAGCFTASGSW